MTVPFDSSDIDFSPCKYSFKGGFYLIVFLPPFKPYEYSEVVHVEYGRLNFVDEDSRSALLSPSK